MHYKFPILFLSLLVLQAATKPACWKKKGRRAVKNWRAFWGASTNSFQRQGQDSLACPALGPDPLNCPSAFFWGGGLTRLRNSCGIAVRCLSLNPGNDSFILRLFVGYAGKPWHPLGSVDSRFMAH